MNLASVLLSAGAPDAPALVSRRMAVSYRDLTLQVDALRAGFRAVGIGAGEHVGFVMTNNPYFAVTYLATLGAGAVAVPLNPSSPADELIAELTSVSASAVVIGPTSAIPLSGVAARVPSLKHVLVTDGVELVGARELSSLVGEPVGIAERADSDPAALLFTAGTAGAPKAAVLTHGSLRANLEQMQAAPALALDPRDVLLGVLPLFHIFGLNVILGLGLYAGASTVLVERFDPATALETVRDRGITVIAGAPPMFGAWAALDGADERALAGVRMAVSGAAALPATTADAFERRFGVRVDQGYGLTEASPTVTSAVGAGAARGSIGRPLPGVDVRLVDDDGNDALAGDAGEIWVRGDNVFSGYLGDAAATSRALTADGWLRTGDVAIADNDGNLYLVDRSKDLVIVSGFNVFPAEVEAVLRDHPGVVEIAVTGVPHPHTGEAVKAYVVARGHVEEDELIDFCGRRLARYKCPSKIMFVDELPRGLGGKLLRRLLDAEQ